MRRLEQRIGRLEATQVNRPRPSGTPEQCCSRFGYSLEQATEEFGSFPAFCYAMLIRRDSTLKPSGGDAHAAYMALLNTRTKKGNPL